MVKETDSERIDKFLWNIRLFKKRSDAKKACNKGRVLVNDQSTKPARVIEPGDVISIKNPPIYKSYKILGVIANRIGAKLVPDYLEDITPPEEKDKLKAVNSNYVRRDRGTGRPTKKERRDIEDFLEDPKF
ncbi:MAG: S4 domain-containing protein [Bacteroidota bacterium]|nr:S4 domain-containing protein [Bacteroidota bacterium]